MKRFASNFIYCSLNKLHKLSVIEVVKSKVTRIFPLETEVESTVWLEGIIVLSQKDQYCVKPSSTIKETIEDLTSDNNLESDCMESSPFAYSISSSDLAALNFQFKQLTESK